MDYVLLVVVVVVLLDVGFLLALAKGWIGFSSTASILHELNEGEKIRQFRVGKCECENCRRK